jgi:hypothetical protein
MTLQAAVFPDEDLAGAADFVFDSFLKWLSLELLLVPF